MRNPSFLYYPKDWQSDPIFGCSLSARGLWHEMMNVMHGCEPYGYLAENGRPMPSERIARRCGTTLEDYNANLAELDAAGIPRRTALGIIFCKRMVEDEKKRREWRLRKQRQRGDQEQVKAYPEPKREVTRDVPHLSRDCPEDLHLHSASLLNTKPNTTTTAQTPRREPMLPVEKSKATPQRVQYAQTAQLIATGHQMLAKGEVCGLGEIKEKLKEIAAAHGLSNYGTMCGNAAEIAVRRHEGTPSYARGRK